MKSQKCDRVLLSDIQFFEKLVQLDLGKTDHIELLNETRGRLPVYIALSVRERELERKL